MAMSFKDIEHLALLLDRSGVSAIEIEESDGRLRLVMETVAAPLPAARHQVARQPEPEGLVARAAIAGLFLAAHPWRAKPFVEPGQVVKAGEVVGLIKVGPVYAPVVSPAAGTVSGIIAEIGALVGYGTPLVALR